MVLSKVVYCYMIRVVWCLVACWCRMKSSLTTVKLSRQLTSSLLLEVCSMMEMRQVSRFCVLAFWFCCTTTVLQPFFRDHPGEPVPEENFWTLWCKGRLTEADTQTVRLGATASGLPSAHLHHSSFFTDWMPFLPPTVTKHWRQLAHSD